MKLFRYATGNTSVKTGAILNGNSYDVSSLVNDYDEAFFEQTDLHELSKRIEQNAAQLPLTGPIEKYLSPIARPSKLVCVGLNYADHARESNMDLPKEPVLFFKSTTALTGPFDDIMLPRNSVKTDWEVELAVVIGKKARYVEEQDALNYVAGYCLHNDVSEREFQLERGGTWDKGKGCDTFAPIGPYLVTPDEIADLNNLRLWLSVNGTMMQDGNTSNLIFKIPFLVSYISQFMTLLPGDIISTGTPAGVGLGFKPPIYLRAGDVVELGIDGLGEAKQTVVDFQ
ncbi:MAG: fumarylacetoacetate hydrolase family protein [Spirosomataceae bacterium]